MKPAMRAIWGIQRCQHWQGRMVRNSNYSRNRLMSTLWLRWGVMRILSDWERGYTVGAWFWRSERNRLPVASSV